jgi:hypothetical protein
VLGDGEELVHRRRLVGEPDTPPRRERITGGVHAVDDDGPGRRRDRPGDREQQRALAGAVRAEEPDDLAAVDLE